MIGRSCLLFLLFLSACAEPKYLENASGSMKAEQVGVLEAAFPSGSFGWLKWEMLPTDENFGSFLLKTGRKNRADNSPIPQSLKGELEIFLWMPSMGHGSSPVTIEEVDTGTYRVSNIFFTMAGDWEIRMQRKLEGILLEEAVLPVRY